jgi:microcystin degradation protein MlrC
MRILAAMLKHETNTFSPVPTDLARFSAWGLYEGEAAQDAYRGTNHPLAAYLDLATERGAEIVTPIAAEAMPSGLVAREAYEHLTGLILDALKAGDFDCAMLDLHGAMVAEPDWDGEGGLLEAMRRSRPSLPIASPSTCTPTSRSAWSATALPDRLQDLPPRRHGRRRPPASARSCSTASKAAAAP